MLSSPLLSSLSLPLPLTLPLVVFYMECLDVYPLKNVMRNRRTLVGHKVYADKLFQFSLGGCWTSIFILTCPVLCDFELLLASYWSR